MNVLAMPSTRRSASQRRRAPQIIDAAARVFAERGFHGATTQDIADVLGIRQASLYYYFSSKEAALELVCLKGVEGFFEAAKTAGADVLHEPRVWPEYHPNYYGAFVRDPDGNNVEAVSHRPE